MLGTINAATVDYIDECDGGNKQIFLDHHAWQISHSKMNSRSRADSSEELAECSHVLTPTEEMLLESGKQLGVFAPAAMGNSSAALPYPHLRRLSDQSTASAKLSLAAMVTINVSGLRFQTRLSTLERYPNTLLGTHSKRMLHFLPETGEYFFDRHRPSFEAILFYYQSSGYLKRPNNIPIDIFVEELRFFEMGDEVIQQFWEVEGYVKPVAVVMPKNYLQRLVWQLMEHPDSSVWARVVAFVSVFVIVLSTSSFCLETLPQFKHVTESSEHNASADGELPLAVQVQNPFFIIETICIVWFTVEFILRFASSPSKLHFMKSFLNWVDFVAIAPFFINLALPTQNASGMSFAVLRVVRLVRVFRIFKLSRHSRGLQILGLTFRASVRELCLLIFFLCIALVLFSSAVYFAETSQSSSSKFTSIPYTFWYTIVTMTTIGYGDLVPQQPLGKFVGSICAIVGVLVIALPVPVIVENFKHFYRQEHRLSLLQSMEQSQNGGVKTYPDDSFTS